VAELLTRREDDGGGGSARRRRDETEGARGVDVVTFGCRLNACESDKIAAQAGADGISNAVVFNTCAVTAEAVRQARQQIRKVRRERPDARLVVTGCAAQIDPAAFAAMPEVDLVLGNADKAAAGALRRSGNQVGDIFAARPSTPGPSPRGGGERARAYVEVQNGCDHRCTFCIIPFGRGNARSLAPERVVAEVRELARAGYAEVMLTGVDLTSWGGELPGRPPLGELVGRILDGAPELQRLRLSSTRRRSTTRCWRGWRARSASARTCTCRCSRATT
jgi:threonylcarbamoyladenosine tRNA methylthiotransferase MtaB